MPTKKLGRPPQNMCCEERHFGDICPDGKVMCCLCFGRFDIDELYPSRPDEFLMVCKPCFESELDEPKKLAGVIAYLKTLMPKE